MEFHLMIVDDEAPIRKGLSQFIDWSSIDCIVDVTASDGAEAIEKLSLYNIDIIITDIKMPETDGIAVAKYIHENFPDIKVIILTGYADFHYAQTAIQYNVVNFLLKPTSKEELIHAVQNAQQKILTSNKKSALAAEELTFLKEQLLQELTDSSPSSGLLARLSLYEIYLDNYFVAAFQLLLPTGNLKTLREIILKQKTIAYCYRYNNLLLAVYSENEQTPYSLFLENCKEIIEFAGSLYSMDILVGISCHHMERSEFSSAASEAIYALTLNFYSSENITCYSDSGNTKPYSLVAEDTLCLCQVENCLNSWKFKEASLQISSMFTRLTSNFAKSIDIKNICSQIYYICSRVLVKKELPPPSADYLTRIQKSSSSSQLEEIIMHLLKELEQNLIYSGKKYSALVECSIQYIHGNLSGTLSLENIAEHVHVNSSHLSRTFKKECGQSITEYINISRIEKAKELLASPNSLAYEISDMTGFNDPAYFSSIFKKYTGFSPKEYRAKMLPKE